MKLRLQITTAATGSTTFESASPLVRIGRDPSCELSLQGEAGKAVSSRHAQIELTPESAILTDTGSSNGTLWNDRPVKGPRPLRIGDRIQLGYTGPTIKVLAIELPDRATTGMPTLSQRSVLIGSVALILALLLLGGSFWLASGKPKPPPPASAGQTAVTEPVPIVAPPPPPPPPPRPQLPAPIQSRPIGRHVSLPQWGPSVLLQRRGDAYPWTLIRQEGKVQTSQTLVGLPGYRSLIMLGQENPATKAWNESGVHLGLWGNHPQFSRFPVLESVVMLNTPAPGIDLDLILDRGLIHIANRKANQPVHVKLRFLQEVWDLVLPTSESEVCAALWSLLPGAPGNPGPTAIPVLSLFNRGPIQLSTSQQKLDLAKPSWVGWMSGGNHPLQPEALPQLPDWWGKPPDAESAQVKDAVVSLLDWHKALEGSDEIVPRILNEIRESKDSTTAVTGLLFLAALNGQQFLVDFLVEDRQRPEVRNTAAHALRIWISQDREFSAEVARLLKTKRGFGQETAELVVKLLQPLSPDALAKPATYQELIGFLNHDNLPVRDLAFWHLVNLTPPGKEKLAYNPVGPPEERQKGMEQWRKLIPPGKLPGK